MLLRKLIIKNNCKNFHFTFKMCFYFIYLMSRDARTSRDTPPQNNWNNWSHHQYTHPLKECNTQGNTHISESVSEQTFCHDLIFSTAAQLQSMQLVYLLLWWRLFLFTTEPPETGTIMWPGPEPVPGKVCRRLMAPPTLLFLLFLLLLLMILQQNSLRGL